MEVINADDFNLFILPSAVDLVTYITRFQWDMAKYPIKQSLKNISEIISKVCCPLVDIMFDYCPNCCASACVIFILIRKYR